MYEVIKTQMICQRTILSDHDGWPVESVASNNKKEINFTIVAIDLWIKILHAKLIYAESNRRYKKGISREIQNCWQLNNSQIACFFSFRHFYCN